jgi:selenide,water dikinase
MKSTLLSPVVKRLLLVGGGHSHLSVLRRLAMKPVPGLETVLVTRDVLTPYSGALPATVAGRAAREDMHIDLRRLAQFAGVRLIRAEVTGIDLEQRHIRLPERPALSFDILSLNIGSQPDTGRIPGAMEYGVPVKPIDKLLAHWEDTRTLALERVNIGKPFALVMVGGGPASVELVLAMQEGFARALADRKAKNTVERTALLHISLLTADSDLLLGHNPQVREAVRRRLASRGIDVLTNHRVSRVEQHAIHCEGDEEISADAIYFATGASVPDWPRGCGLAVDEKGFIAVNDRLQSTSHPFVFASGDAASMIHTPRPKSGVYAVRQGRPLADNLVRYATGRRLRSYRPQRHALALLYSGEGTAIASRDTWYFQGRWVWLWKQRIDRQFLHKYGELPPPRPDLHLAPGLTDKATEAALRQHAMRCAGCGAKVGAGTLTAVLQQLQSPSRDDVESQAGAEDAAIVHIDGQRSLLQTVDFLPAMVSDPWLFGRIATNHCLSDIYAMGCEPHSALATVGVPFAGRRFMAETLGEIMAGATAELRVHDTALIGGHSTETAQLSFGLCVNGFARTTDILRKGGLRSGDLLVLTKPLGTGTLLAADMRHQARGDWMEAAIASMLQSNRDAARCLVAQGATACTDITGFGLAGHLLEMLTAQKIKVSLELEALPVLDGALECLQQGIHSSLHDDNKAVSEAIGNAPAFTRHPRFDLLFDPQTAGGLLAGIPATQADDCLAVLHKLGYAHAAIIGRVLAVAAEVDIELY